MLLDGMGCKQVAGQGEYMFVGQRVNTRRGVAVRVGLCTAFLTPEPCHTTLGLAFLFFLSSLPLNCLLNPVPTLSTPTQIPRRTFLPTVRFRNATGQLCFRLPSCSMRSATLRFRQYSFLVALSK